MRGGVPDLTGKVIQPTVVSGAGLAVVRVFLAGSDSLPRSGPEWGSQYTRPDVDPGDCPAGRAWGALGQRDQKWVSS